MPRRALRLLLLLLLLLLLMISRRLPDVLGILSALNSQSCPSPSPAVRHTTLVDWSLKAEPFSVLGVPPLAGALAVTGAQSSLHLPAPQGVMVYSYNFRSSLRWSPVEVDGGPPLYTVHFKTGAFNQWDEMNCTRISRTECDFPQQLSEPRWTITLRVRAELGAAVSDWVQSEPFVAERNTIIGPPRVSSVSQGQFSDSLLINVTPPFALRRSDLLHYLVSYWENSTSTMKKVRSLRMAFVHSASGSCDNDEQNAIQNYRSQGVDTILFESANRIKDIARFQDTWPAKYPTVLQYDRQRFAIASLFLIWRYHSTIKYWSQPPFKIPSHFKEYLQDPSMTLPEALESHVEDDPCDFLPVVCSREGSQEGDASVEDETPSPSSSRESE
ncbi:interferon gamma receptor 2 [Eudromia elegans]